MPLSRQERYMIAFEKAKTEPCPNCKNVGDNAGWMILKQKHRMFASEPNPSEYINETREEKEVNHPQSLLDHADFRVLVCANCGFTKFFFFPDF